MRCVAAPLVPVPSRKEASPSPPLATRGLGPCVIWRVKEKFAVEQAETGADVQHRCGAGFGVVDGGVVGAPVHDTVARRGAVIPVIGCSRVLLKPVIADKHAATRAEVVVDLEVVTVRWRAGYFL